MATLPVSPAQVERVLAGFEARLNKAEGKALRILVMGLLASQDRLLAQLGPQYVVTLAATKLAGRAIKEARARQLVQQVRGVLDLIPPTAERDLLELIETSATAGRESAATLIRLHDPALTQSFSQLPREALLAAASNSHARLLQHGEVAAQKMSQHIVSGIASGTSWRKVATEIKNEVGITRRQAETIVRTESMQAMHVGKQEAMRAQGIEYTQRLETNDPLVCGWCAAIAGNVYKLGEEPGILHPNDRFAYIPWKPEWQQAGLTDDEWVREHRATVEKQVAERGEKVRSGPSPFMQKNGVTEMPTPVWTP
jgi:SPP1 gp7 family putative phage head morphogenesis protein